MQDSGAVCPALPVAVSGWGHLGKCIFSRFPDGWLLSLPLALPHVCVRLFCLFNIVRVQVMALGTFMVLCSHHCHPSPELSHVPTETRHPLDTPHFCSPAPGDPRLLSVLVWPLWGPRIGGTVQCWFFVSGLLHLVEHLPLHVVACVSVSFPCKAEGCFVVCIFHLLSVCSALGRRWVVCVFWLLRILLL